MIKNAWLESEFEDYYDQSLAVLAQSGLAYNRVRTINNRNKELAKLKDIGIETIKLTAATRIWTQSSRVVVYTDAGKHDGKGKEVYSLSEAQLMFNSSLVSEYIPQKDGIGYKMLYIGKLGFKCTMLYRDGIHMAGCLDITPVQGGYNKRIGLPIYSIDYININGKLVACDFNEVENLSMLGFWQVMNAESIAGEIMESLLMYGG